MYNKSRLGKFRPTFRKCHVWFTGVASACPPNIIARTITRIVLLTPCTFLHVGCTYVGTLRDHHAYLVLQCQLHNHHQIKPPHTVDMNMWCVSCHCPSSPLAPSPSESLRAPVTEDKLPHTLDNNMWCVSCHPSSSPSSPSPSESLPEPSSEQTSSHS